MVDRHEERARDRRGVNWRGPVSCEPSSSPGLAGRDFVDISLQEFQQEFYFGVLCTYVGVDGAREWGRGGLRIAVRGCFVKLARKNGLKASMSFYDIHFTRAILNILDIIHTRICWGRGGRRCR